MDAKVRSLIGAGVLGFLTACTAAAPTVDPADVQATVEAILTVEAAQVPTPTPVPTALPGPSFEAATYADEISGFAFDHPAGWTIGPLEQQSRGGITPFTSWERPTDVLPDQTPPGGTRLDAVVQLWDPKGDLEAFVGQRKTAWDASGITVTAEEAWTLSDGRPATGFVVKGIDGAEAYFFFTTLGDKYLVLSGEGDLTLLAEIAHTVRPLPLGY